MARRALPESLGMVSLTRSGQRNSWQAWQPMAPPGWGCWWRGSMMIWPPSLPDLNPLNFVIWSNVENKACSFPHSVLMLWRPPWRRSGPRCLWTLSRRCVLPSCPGWSNVDILRNSQCALKLSIKSLLNLLRFTLKLHNTCSFTVHDSLCHTVCTSRRKKYTLELTWSNGALHTQKGTQKAMLNLSVIFGPIWLGFFFFFWEAYSHHSWLGLKNLQCAGRAVSLLSAWLDICVASNKERLVSPPLGEDGFDLSGVSNSDVDTCFCFLALLLLLLLH